MVLRPKVGVQTVGRHGVSHEKGGSDELSVDKLNRYEELVKTKIDSNSQLVSTKSTVVKSKLAPTVGENNALWLEELDASGTALSVRLRTKNGVDWDNLYPQTTYKSVVSSAGKTLEEEILSLKNDKATQTDLTSLEQRLTSSGYNYVYVDAVAGKWNNDGSKELPFLSLQNAIDHLERLGSKLSFGAWSIRVKGYGDLHTYNGARIQNMPYLKSELKIVGDVDTDGNPTTIFKPTNSGTIGLWVEPGIREMSVENIEFKDFTNGFNGYGFIIKSNGKARLVNCRATRCDLGFACVNSAIISCSRCIADSCTTGYTVSYGSTATFGSSNGFYADGKGGSISTNCDTGVSITRNAVAHVDYMNIEDCKYAGIDVNMSSRVHVMVTHFKRNGMGVRSAGAAEWINNNSVFFEGTVDENTVNYENFGVARETRLYSQTSKNEFRIYSNIGSMVHTGSTTKSLLLGVPSSYYIPQHFLAYPGRKVRVVISGQFAGSGVKTLSATLQNVSPDSNSIISGSDTLVELGRTTDDKTRTDFVMEYEIDTMENKQHINSGTTTTNLSHNYAYSLVRNTSDTTARKQLRIHCQLDDPASKITIHKVEMYLMG